MQMSMMSSLLILPRMVRWRCVSERKVSRFPRNFKLDLYDTAYDDHQHLHI